MTPSVKHEQIVMDFDSLMNKLMLMRAINRPTLSDIMVAPVGHTWNGTKPNGTPWEIAKLDENNCELVVNS